MRTVGIVGAGGFGREIYPLALQQLASDIQAGTARLSFVVEDGYATGTVNGHDVLTWTEFCRQSGDLYFTVAIADGAARKRITLKALAEGMRPYEIKCRTSIILEGSTIGPGAILAPFTLITANSVIGASFHANYYSCVTHDCIIGDYVTFGPRAQCNGNVVIGDGAYIGSGALIKQGSAARRLTIGEGAVVGMGAVVTRDVAPFTTVIGNPARPMKPAK